MNLAGAIRNFIFLPDGADARAPRPGGGGFPRPDDSDFTSHVIDLEPIDSLDVVQLKTEDSPPAASRRSHRGTIIDIRI